jgi:branched-chain amino acid transport system ATP-binding protein
MLLEANRLSVGYGGAPAIVDVSIAVDDREIVAVIGPNGAGKSTLINSIAGLLRPQDGELRFAGGDLAAIPAHRICSQGIALVPEGRRLFTGMSVEENLEIGSYRSAARKLQLQGLERVYALFPVLRLRRQQIAGTLSGGQQQMVAIGRALIHAEGISILLVEQNVALAMAIADRAYVLEEGRIVAAGVPAELLAQSRIQEAYLGV